jgi:hypothetical protein
VIRVLSGEARAPLADPVEHAGAEPMLEFDPTELLVPLVRRETFQFDLRVSQTLTVIVADQVECAFATPESAEAEPSWGLGAKVVTTTEPLFAPWGPVGSHRVELTWGGTLGEGQSGFSHFLWMNDLLSPSDVRTMSVAAVTNTNRRLGDFDADGHWTSKIRDEALALMQEGGWDSADIDLFPDLDLD